MQLDVFEINRNTICSDRLYIQQVVIFVCVRVFVCVRFRELAAVQTFSVPVMQFNQRVKTYRD